MKGRLGTLMRGQLHYYEAHCVAAVRGLPGCLEHLTLRACTPAIFDFVFDLISGDTPPGLKTVKLVFHDDHPMELYDEDTTYWEGEALKKGIVLTRERSLLSPSLDEDDEVLTAVLRCSWMSR
jgi:hypothetical protein